MLLVKYILCVAQDASSSIKEKNNRGVTIIQISDLSTSIERLDNHWIQPCYTLLTV
jgi:hypothetical protein